MQILKKNGLGMTVSIISNEKMEGIMKTIKSLEESGLLVNRISSRNSSNSIICEW